jgi:hypothetical protein
MPIIYMRDVLRACVSIGFLFLLSGLPMAPAAFAGTITGPITGGAHGWSFGAPGTAVDLSRYGYVQEEFFIEGNANSYTKVGTWARDGVWTAALGASMPFRTRLLVVRPADSAMFNGTVVVEWLNVSAGWDIADVFAHAKEELLRGGFGWVGVSVQAVGVQLSPFSLKAWDPVRYGSLSHPGDAYAYDIFTQAGQAIRQPTGVNVLGGLTAERVIAAGHSQAANGLATYANAIHPLAHEYNGFLLYSRGAAPLPLFPGADGAVPAASIIRTDMSTPVIALQDEWSIAVTAAWLVRQADTPTFRIWEVAGTGHADRDMDAFTGPIVQRDLGFPRLVCAAPMNEAPLRYLVHLAINGLDAWIADREPPPHAPSFVEVASGALVRDAYGNARGGIRLPQLEVPTATHTGVGNAGPGSCPTAGITKPFDAQTLFSLYPNHGTYVSQFVRATNDLRRSGFLLEYDSDDAKLGAAQSNVGHGP